METKVQSLSDALWRIYHRPERPVAWTQDGNLPWNDPEFSARMLCEHLDETHGAASRVIHERTLQIDWLWCKLDLHPGDQICDLTCGPGLYAVELARRGCHITGIDFGPAAIAYARQLAEDNSVAGRCTFIEQDVRQADLGLACLDAALFWYGQLAVFCRQEAQALLGQVARALKPGGKLAIELLDQQRVDKSRSTWWYTDNSGLWGDGPYLHLGERFWDDETQMSSERFYILHLETNWLTEIHLCDQTYSSEAMIGLMKEAGFSQVDVYPASGGVPVYDAPEWVIYVAKK
jgi:SAM-dependent methyltransferase